MRDRSDDYFWQLLSLSPAAWALIRANEIRVLESVTFKPPVLDVGCGDGSVAKVILEKRGGKFDWGIDLSESELSKAKKSGSYGHCKIASVYSLPFKDRYFQTVFSNSVIEHLDDLNKAISEISRVLRNHGQLVITVPTPYLTKYLWGRQNLGDWYGKFFNFLFKHKNLHTHTKWKKILEKHNLRIVDYRYYHTQETIQIHELLSFLAIPQQISKFIFGHWVMLPSLRRIFVIPWLYGLLKRFYLADSKKNEGGSLLIIAEKAAS